MKFPALLRIPALVLIASSLLRSQTVSPSGSLPATQKDGDAVVTPAPVPAKPDTAKKEAPKPSTTQKSAKDPKADSTKKDAKDAGKKGGTSKKDEPDKIEGVTITRAKGGYLGLKVVNNN